MCEYHNPIARKGEVGNSAGSMWIGTALAAEGCHFSLGTVSSIIELTHCRWLFNWLVGKNLDL